MTASGAGHEGIKVAPPQAAPLYAPDWGEEQRAHVAQFLASNAGGELLNRGRAVEFQLCRQACAEPFNVSHSAGLAKGWRDCLDWIESLSRVSARSSDTTGPDAGWQRASAQQSETEDTPSRGDAALRERYSP